MSESKLRTQSMDFAVSIINLVKYLKEKRESIISNQIGRSGTSIGANIREAQYAHGKADFIAKLQIALKEANETGYWLDCCSKLITYPKKNIKFLTPLVQVFVLCSSPPSTPQRRMQNEKESDTYNCYCWYFNSSRTLGIGSNQM